MPRAAHALGHRVRQRAVHARAHAALPPDASVFVGRPAGFSFRRRACVTRLGDVGAAAAPAGAGGAHRGGHRDGGPGASRAALRAAASRAGGELLDLGDFVAASGPLPHAGPETSNGEDWVILFLTCNLPGGGPPYDQETQTLPFHAALFKSFDDNEFSVFTSSLKEWKDRDPWVHFTQPPTRGGKTLRDEVKIYLATKQPGAAASLRGCWDELRAAARAVE